MSSYASSTKDSEVIHQPHATGSTPRASTKFTTQAPTIAVEQAKGSALFHAYEDLVTRVVTWTTRLLHEHQQLAATAAASPLASHPAERSANVRLDQDFSLRSFHGTREHRQLPIDVPVLVASPSTRASPTRKHSPSRRHTQTAGEDAGARRELFHGLSSPMRSEGSGSSKPVTSDPTTPLIPSSTSTSTTLSGNATTPTTQAMSHCGTSASLTGDCRTPTSESLRVPSWLSEELAGFFETRLAYAIRVRETDLVNVIHECVLQEVQAKDRRLEDEHQQRVHLESQVASQTKLHDHLQSKLDRRIAENNALRKDFYKQLLMLRELVAKHRSDPRTMKALDEVISTVMTGKAEPSAVTSPTKTSLWSDRKATKTEEPASIANVANSSSMRREKEKWEQRAREAAAECESLQEQLLQCKQELEEARKLDGELWFGSAQHGLFERQRIIDCVYKSKCSWDQVGESIIELLNNDMIWEAVEDSAYKEKSRVSRGLEALLHRMESVNSGIGDNNRQVPEAVADSTEGVANDASGKRTITRRRSAFSQASRLIMCRACNGCGYLDASATTDNDADSSSRQEPDEPQDDSYLRKTLAQVLELKAALEEANMRTNQVEQELLRTVIEGAQVKEALEKIQYTRAHSIDSCLQTDLDDEEEIDMDAIMKSQNSGDSVDGVDGTPGLKRRGGRWKQYEHLIVELKNLLDERDAGIAQMKSTVADAQTRLVTVQRTSQQEQERLQRELQTLKGSLALAMSSRNEVIEEKQAAVKMLLKTMDRKKTSVAVPPVNFLSLAGAGKPVEDGEKSDGSSESRDEDGEEEDDDGFEGEDEVARSERIARRYSDAISRVQQEYEEQQQRLKQAEEELGSESDKRKRTNSINLGSIVITMSSHPRDIYKALSTTHQELLSVRRSSQRASALQTDRLLTLTTHLAHISEELAMVKKRTCAEIDFWKLDCEKLQNANKALAADFQTAQKHLEEAQERITNASAVGNAVKVCGICEKHEARLLEISTHLLSESVPSSDVGEIISRRKASGQSRSARDSVELSDAERSGLSSILLDLENLYSTLNSGKQQQAKAAITRALLGGNTYANRVASTSSTGYASSSESKASQSVHYANSLNKESHTTPSMPSSTSGRLFTADVLENLRAPRQSDGGSVRNSVDSELDEPGLQLHGRSIDTTSSTRDGSPSHRRKTIVRKVLSENEVAQRRFARTRHGESVRRLDQLEETSESPIQHAASIVDDLNDEESSEYSSFVNESGERVFYVDVEVDDEPDARPTVEQPATIHQPRSINLELEGTNSDSEFVHRHSDYTVQIPSPTCPVSVPSPSPRMSTSADIAKDPEVILQLKELVSHSSTTRELLALANWRILVTNWRASRDKRRLDYVNKQYHHALEKGTIRPATMQDTTTLPQAVRTTMQKIVQYRELVVDAAIRSRDDLRRELRRAQAHLIHGVSNVLTNLSRKNKIRIPTSDTLQLVHLDPETSPSRAPTPSLSPLRPLYPSVKVNLSDVPASQQIPTPSFPVTRAASPTLETISTSFSSPNPQSSVTSSIKSRLDDYQEPPEVSIFENDNRFPQRVIRFVPAGDGDDLSLVHATSSIRLPSTSPKSSPTKSPQKASLTLDLRRRPTHSASSVRSVPVNISAPNPSEATDLASQLTQLTDPIVSTLRRPTRPQSSPAGTSSRFRASHLHTAGEE